MWEHVVSWDVSATWLKVIEISLSEREDRAHALNTTLIRMLALRLIDSHYTTQLLSFLQTHSLFYSLLLLAGEDLPNTPELPALLCWCCNGTVLDLAPLQGSCTLVWMYKILPTVLLKCTLSKYPHNASHSCWKWTVACSCVYVGNTTHCNCIARVQACGISPKTPSSLFPCSCCCFFITNDLVSEFYIRPDHNLCC